jgi:hypothetical protein
LEGCTNIKIAVRKTIRQAVRVSWIGGARITFLLENAAKTQRGEKNEESRNLARDPTLLLCTRLQNQSCSQHGSPRKPRYCTVTPWEPAGHFRDLDLQGMLSAATNF